MIVNTITVTSAELATGNDNITELSETTGIVKGGFTQKYYPQSLIVDNQTGGIVSYLPLSTPEKTTYDTSSGTISDFLELENLKYDTISYLQGEVDFIIVKGDTTNTADLDIKIIKGSY